MRRMTTIELTEDQSERLEGMARSRSLAARLVQRAHIVLMGAKGHSQREIGLALGCDFKTVAEWQRRWKANAFEGLEKERPGRGRKAWVLPGVCEDVVRMTIEERPGQGTQWSTRTMAEQFGIGPTTVRKIWKLHGLKPHRFESFKLSNDPHFEEKLVDVVGLYLDPPEHAIVLSVDEKSQIQALDRTQPGLPMKKGRCGTKTHDYKRNGTTTLFAAMNVLDGSILSTTMERHRHTEWLKFLQHLDRKTPKKLALEIICDNYATHKHPAVKAWLEAHPRVHIHFTPTSSSWLNMVERFFLDLTENRLRRGVFHSVKHLEGAIQEYIDHHNRNPKPFIWKAEAKDILAKVLRARSVRAATDKSRDLG